MVGTVRYHHGRPQGPARSPSRWSSDLIDYPDLSIPALSPEEWFTYENNVRAALGVAPLTGRP